MVKQKKIQFGSVTRSVVALCLFMGVVGGVLFERYSYESPTPKNVTKAPFFHLPAPQKGPYLGAYLAGSMARRNGDIDLAADYYQRALALDKDNKLLVTYTYAVERDNGHFDKMLSLAQRMQELGSQQSEPVYVQLTGLIKKGDYAAALDLLQTKPGVFAPDAALRIWCLIGMGDINKAWREWNALNVQTTKSDTNRLQKALIAGYLGDAEKEKEAYLSVLQVEDPTLNALTFAKAFSERNKTWSPSSPFYAAYLKKLEESDSLAGVLSSVKAPVIDTPIKGMAEVFHGLMIDATAQGNVNTALLAALMAQYLNPDAPLARVFAAQLYEVTHSYRQAIEQYDLLPDADIFKFKRAVNFVALGDTAAALAMLEPIKDRFISDETAQLLLAEIYLTEKRYKEALHHYNLFLTLVPAQSVDWIRALFARGVAFHELGDTASAERDIAAAANYAPEDPVILNYIGYLWLTQDKNIEKAVQMIEKAVALSPDDPNFLDSLALGYYKQEKFNEAVRLAERATDMLPQSAIINEHLGDIYAAVGRNREAQYQYQKALALNTDLKEEDKKRLQSKIK